MPKTNRTGSAELLQGMLAAERSAIQENEEGARLGRDPECVHRMRVATRRARAALRTASGVLEPEREERLGAELSWLGGVLGGVRDLDVLTARLRAESEALEASEQVALEPLFASLAAERRKARSSLTRALKSARYRRLVDELGDAAVSAPPPNGRISLDKRAGKQFDRLVKSMEKLGSEPADEELHRARKLGKRARYAAELAAPQTAKPTKRFVQRAKAFQDVTGEHQDAVVAEEKLRALVAKADREQAFAAGRLAQRERERQAAARELLPKAWKELERAGQRTWS
jgi:CHAD domain-containing protein